MTNDEVPSAAIRRTADPVPIHLHGQMRSELRATDVEQEPSCVCSAQLAAHPLLLYASAGDHREWEKYTRYAQLLRSKSSIVIFVGRSGDRQR